MWAFWDAGQLVERMYGHVRFTSIYLVSGLFGNLVSLVFQGNSAVSGGASGAIFGIYGALLIYLWFNRLEISLREFRWLFGGATAFSLATIVFGFIVPGIDNSAHVGGFTAGILTSIFLFKPIHISIVTKKISYSAIILLVIATFLLILNMPKPKYLWRDELLLQNKINEFTFQEQEINRSWLEILHEQKKSGLSLNELAGKVETKISEPYEDSFEKLSQLPSNAALPSAVKLKSLIAYTKQRKEESKALAEKFRE
jgi:rhomboid protease GluP